jgi:hypothetical protein
LAGALILNQKWFPATENAHLLGWITVLGLALTINYGALMIWFLFNQSVQRNAAMLVPAVDALPPLLMSAVFSAAFIVKGEYDLLPGMWMALFGLAHMAYRQSLPITNYAVGAFYVISGAFCLLLPGLIFTDPLPMGITFFIGELAGGCILYRNNILQEKENEHDA